MGQTGPSRVGRAGAEGHAGSREEPLARLVCSVGWVQVIYIYIYTHTQIFFITYGDDHPIKMADQNVSNL
jgi:hypothetical protein